MCGRIKQKLTAFCAQEDLSELTPETAALMAEGIGEEPAFLVEDKSDISEGLLVVETPSQGPGVHDLRLEDPENDADYVYEKPFVYTANPFEDGTDQFPGEIRLIQDTPYAVTTAGGSLPVDGGELQPLEYETPEGILIEVPVEALPENVTTLVTSKDSVKEIRNIIT